MLRFIFSVLILFYCFSLLAQKEVVKQVDTTGIAIRLSADLILPGRTVFETAQKGGFEVQAGFLLNQFRMQVELGREHTNRGENYEYDNSGRFFKIGPEINLIKNAKDGLELTFGMRYAQSNFQNSLRYDTDDSFNSTVDITENNLVTRWGELTTGLSTKIGKRMTMGYTIRYKILRSDINSDILLPFDIPGFGRRDDSNEVGFNYYIGWLIPLK